MTARGFVLAAVVMCALNWALTLGRSRRVEENRVLNELDANRGRERALARTSSRERSALADLVGRAPEPFAVDSGVGPLRRALIEAEAELTIDRLSLEFRPDETAPEVFTGARVQASLEGPFHVVHRYLAIVEEIGLPLSPDQLVVRSGRDGNVLTASVRWTARWATDSTRPPPSISPAETATLATWLSPRSSSVPERDPFQRSSDRSAIRAAAATPMSEPEPAAEPVSDEATAVAAVVPVLTGFILARPELEEDVDRRVLAALSFDGELFLVQIGDTVGDYVVERIAARESVTLSSTSDGGELVLTFP